MQKILDARPMMTMYFGVMLVLVGVLVLWNRETEAASNLLLEVRHQHALKQLPFEFGNYTQRCVSDVVCIQAYVTEGWRKATSLERSCVVALLVGFVLTLIGRYWNPAMFANTKTQSMGMSQNSLPAQSAKKPGSWF